MTTIKLKNGSGAPTAGDLAQGEPALDLTNKRLYTEDSGGTVIEVGTNPGVDVTFADNRKAVFGADSDLQIYHDGSASYIADTGTGTLNIKASGSIRLRGNDTDELLARFNENGSNQFYYDSSEKLATTATGIDVTGTVTADGLTVDGNATFTTADNTAQLTLVSTDTDALVGPQLNLWRNSGTGTNGDLIGEVTFTGEDTVGSTNTFATISAIAEQTNNGSEDGSLHFKTLLNGTLAKRLSIGAGSTGGDISFYEDTGTTAKFFWDASAESLGIGTSSPSFPLEVDGGTGDGIKIKAGNTSNDDSFLVANSSNTTMFLVDGGGQVGIGTDSPSATGLHISQNNANAELTLQRTGTFTGNFKIYSGGGSTNRLVFRDMDASSDRVTIDSSGNLLVGRTSAGSGTGFEANTAFGSYILSTSTSIAGVFDRLSTDGEIVQFRKDGVAVGQINARSGDLVIGTGTTGLQFYDVGNAIFPLSASGNTNRDAAIDLGEGSNRFKDLYLSSKTKYQASGGNQHSVGVDVNDLIIRSETAGSETARFTYGGNLLVGTTSGTGHKIRCVASGSDRNLLMQCANGGVNAVTLNTSGTADYTAFLFTTDGGNTQTGSVVVGGSSTAYNTSSDQRLKDNIVDAPSASDDIDAIQVRSFDWKADGSHQKYGMVAQELQSVAPEAVTGDADSEDMMGVDYSKLVPMMLKEIQSLRARVAQLEGEN